MVFGFLVLLGPGVASMMAVRYPRKVSGGEMVCCTVWVRAAGEMDCSQSGGQARSISHGIKGG